MSYLFGKPLAYRRRAAGIVGDDFKYHTVQLSLTLVHDQDLGMAGKVKDSDTVLFFQTLPNSRRSMLGVGGDGDKCNQYTLHRTDDIYRCY